MIHRLEADATSYPSSLWLKIHSIEAFAKTCSGWINNLNCRIVRREYSVDQYDPIPGSHIIAILQSIGLARDRLETDPGSSARSIDVGNGETTRTAFRIRAGTKFLLIR